METTKHKGIVPHYRFIDPSRLRIEFVLENKSKRLFFLEQVCLVGGWENHDCVFTHS
jgi:hypothetical protein